MRRVDVGVQEGDRDALDAVCGKPGRRGFDRRFVERQDRIAGGVEPFGNWEAPPPGTSGTGFSMSISYCSKRLSVPISMESRKPSVVIRAVRAPLRSISALVASVVP